MTGFSLLWGTILNSSIWVKETKETRLVWITMLAMKDFEGVVKSSFVGLADRAKVSEDECRAALEVLTSPDPNDTSGVDEGRRLVVVPGIGWRVVNHDLYRFSTEAKRAFWRETKQRQRDLQKQSEEQSSCKVNREIVETPTLESVKLLFAKSGGTEGEAEKFFNYYQSNGWRVGRNRMKSVAHAAAGWILRAKEKNYGKNNGPVNPRLVGVTRGPTDYGALARAKAGMAGKVGSVANPPPPKSG